MRRFICDPCCIKGREAISSSQDFLLPSLSFRFLFLRLLLLLLFLLSFSLLLFFSSRPSSSFLSISRPAKVFLRVSGRVKANYCIASSEFISTRTVFGSYSYVFLKHSPSLDTISIRCDLLLHSKQNNQNINTDHVVTLKNGKFDNYTCQTG